MNAQQRRPKRRYRIKRDPNGGWAVHDRQRGLTWHHATWKHAMRCVIVRTQIRPTREPT